MSDMSVGNPARTPRRRRETASEPAAALEPSEALEPSMAPESSAAPETAQDPELPILGPTIDPDGNLVIVDMEHDDYVEAVRQLRPTAQNVQRSQLNPALIVAFN
jgi:hypothetical protein